MNIYLVVEGKKTEPIVYPKWIKYINPQFKIVQDIDEVCDNHILMISGGGFPSYLSIIKNAALDVASNERFDRLVIAIDSEEMTYVDKRAEIEDFVNNLNLNIEYKVVVQHFCIETWALGNRILVPRQSDDERVKMYRDIWDVLDNDPAGLPPLSEDINRAQFAEKYLKALINAHYRNLTYSKWNPKVLLDRKYFNRVKSRFEDTDHIASFNDFLTAFV